MRDNVSIIFAAIFAVLLLIVFPLFSLLTRQDNIAYNKVLTLTTEFVDSVRTKGYFTEEEYTDYLVGLSNTKNTYKVEMECHKKLLIKDIDKYTDDNPVWVEDTAIYYNSYVVEALNDSHVLSLDEGDEFYIKLYNTNITTASLMYNFFLGSSIPRKIINIGYGGKVLNSTGDSFTKTTFNSSYTPYVTFEEVVNSSGSSFKYCYDAQTGIYEIQTCVRRVDLNKKENNPIKVNFKLYNFNRIGEKEVNSMTFEANKSYFIDKIEDNAKLRANYVTSYKLEIQDLKMVGDNIEGTIVVTDIVMSDEVWKTTGFIVISSDLGTGPTGVASSEGTTVELTLVQDNSVGSIEIEGPYLNKTTNDFVTGALNNKETVYYKVVLENASEIKKLELYDTVNSKVIASYTSFNKELVSDDYKVNVSSGTNNNEYWISVKPTYADSGDMFTEIKKELQLIVYADNGRAEEMKAISGVALWEKLTLSIKLNLLERYGSSEYCSKIQFESNSNSSIVSYLNESSMTRKAFFQKLVDSGYIYISKGTSTTVADSQFSISITSVDYTTTGTSTWYVYYTISENYISGAPVNATLYFNFKESTGSVKSYSFTKYINIPRGYTFNLINGNKTIYKDGITYYWIPASESVMYGGINATNYYDNDVTEQAILESIRKYGGIYVAQNSVYAGNFYETWNWAKSVNNEQLFSSMAYNWILDARYYAFGFNLPIGANANFWLASSLGNNQQYARYQPTQYSIYYIELAYSRYQTGIYGIQVLYLK